MPGAGFVGRFSRLRLRLRRGRVEAKWRRTIYQYLWELLHFAKIFSCGESQSKFLRVRFLGGHQRCEDGSARLGDEVTMGMRQLSNQAMGAQQAQLTAHRRGAAPRRLFVPWFAQIEQALQVAVAQSGDCPLAAAQCADQGRIGAEGMEATVALSVVGERTAQRRRCLSQRRR